MACPSPLVSLSCVEPLAVCTGTAIGNSVCTGTAIGNSVCTGTAIGNSVCTGTAIGNSVCTGTAIGKSVSTGVPIGTSVSTGIPIGTSVSTGVPIGILVFLGPRCNTLLISSYSEGIDGCAIIFANISFTEKLGCFASSFSNCALPIPITSGIPPGMPPGITLLAVLVSDVIFFSTFDNDIFPENKNKKALEAKFTILNPLLIYIPKNIITYICPPTNANSITHIIKHAIIFKIK